MVGIGAFSGKRAGRPAMFGKNSGFCQMKRRESQAMHANSILCMIKTLCFHLFIVFCIDEKYRREEWGWRWVSQLPRSVLEPSHDPGVCGESQREASTSWSRDFYNLNSTASRASFVLFWNHQFAVEEYFCFAAFLTSWCFLITNPTSSTLSCDTPPSPRKLSNTANMFANKRLNKVCRTKNNTPVLLCHASTKLYL